MAFELVAGRPVVALARELIRVTLTEAVRVPVPFPVTGLVSDGSSKLVVTGADGIHEMTPAGWSPSARFDRARSVARQLGFPIPAGHRLEFNTTGFKCRSMDSSLPSPALPDSFVQSPGTPRDSPRWWGSSLVTWKVGADTLHTLRTDPALAEARGLNSGWRRGFPAAPLPRAANRSYHAGRAQPSYS